MILEVMKIKICHSFHCVLIYLPSRVGTGWHDLNVLNVEVKSTCLISTFISAKSSSNSSSVFCYLHIWVYWYFSQQFWFLFVLHPVTFCMMYFASKLNKWGDNKITLTYSFTNSEQLHCSCLILLPRDLHRFLRSQVKWSSIPTSLRISRNFCDPHSQML